MVVARASVGKQFCWCLLGITWSPNTGTCSSVTMVTAAHRPGWWMLSGLDWKSVAGRRNRSNVRTIFHPLLIQCWKLIFHRSTCITLYSKQISLWPLVRVPQLKLLSVHLDDKQRRVMSLVMSVWLIFISYVLLKC